MTVQPLHPEAGASAPDFSEEAIALAFATRHAHELRHVAAWNKWFLWDGKRWREDDTRKVFSLARALCRETADPLNRPNERRRIASAKTRAAIVSLASDDRRLAATIDVWDTDPWLLNTPGGVVDLRTGNTRAHRPEDYITKIAAFAPGGDCPRWKEFIKKVTNGNDDFATYLARMSGYGLTGKIGEHAMFFLWGRGGNGKSQYLLATSRAMGDYHCAAPIDVFTESQTDRHPTELAMLMGARLVTAVEPEQGRRWSETRIKQLTGGDAIRARFMRQDFFEYIPQFKLLFAGNNKPGLRSVDEAIRRRVNILPFKVTITEAEKIIDYAEKLLRDEGPGILQWMINGCIEWQRIGLAPPEVVRKETEDYFKNENVFASWMEECTAQSSSEETTLATCFSSWKGWATERNEFVGTSRLLSQRLGQYYDKAHSNIRIKFKGVALSEHEKARMEARAAAAAARAEAAARAREEEPF